MNRGLTASLILLALAACGTRSEPAPVVEVQGASSARGSVTVQPGDTVFAIARRHGVSAQEIIRVNGLVEPYTIRVGQVLALPGTATGGSPPGTVPTGAPSPGSVTTSPSRPGAIEVTPLAPLPPGPVSAAPPGEPASPQQTVNAFPQAGPIVTRPEPPPAPAQGERPAQAEAPAPIQSASTAEPPPRQALLAPPGPGRPASTTATGQTASTQSSVAPIPVPEQRPASGSGEPPARSSARFAWPVSGRLLSDFGPKPGGVREDGIKIAAPAGTPVVAAENGVVAHAGSSEGLAPFGNLVLIRHADGWITAYAHLERMQVQVGERVRRGQQIGTVGKTGDVPSPQLHFELRRDAKPVNPLDHLDAVRGGVARG